MSIVGYPWLHNIPLLADGTMETNVYTSEVAAIPTPFSLVSNMFLKLLIGLYGYEDLIFKKDVEIQNMC
jgi:hypothetical protein